MSPKPAVPPLLTVKQASSVLGVSPRRVRQFIEEGRLRATKMAGAYLVKRNALLRFAKKERPQGNLTGRPRKMPKT